MDNPSCRNSPCGWTTGNSIKPASSQDKSKLHSYCISLPTKWALGSIPPGRLGIYNYKSTDSNCTSFSSLGKATKEWLNLMRCVSKKLIFWHVCFIQALLSLHSLPIQSNKSIAGGLYLSENAVGRKDYQRGGTAMGQGLRGPGKESVILSWLKCFSCEVMSRRLPTAKAGIG